MLDNKATVCINFNTCWRCNKPTWIWCEKHTACI